MLWISLTVVGDEVSSTSNSKNAGEIYENTSGHMKLTREKNGQHRSLKETAGSKIHHKPF